MWKKIMQKGEINIIRQKWHQVKQHGACLESDG
jgi:hypothetical protein